MALVHLVLALTVSAASINTSTPQITEADDDLQLAMPDEHSNEETKSGFIAAIVVASISVLIFLHAIYANCCKKKDADQLPTTIPQNSSPPEPPSPPSPPKRLSPPPKPPSPPKPPKRPSPPKPPEVESNPMMRLMTPTAMRHKLQNRGVEYSWSAE